jgi:hypothetical protein
VSESQHQLTLVAQELQQKDSNGISANAALSDDRVLGELLRLYPEPSPNQKFVLPYGISGNKTYHSLDSTALVQSSGVADGRIRVMPFRGGVYVGGATPKEEWRGLRSQVFTGPTGIYKTFTLTPNVAPNPLWALIYVAITPDADEATEDRFVKDRVTKVVAPASVVITKNTAIAVAISYGTPDVSPTRPAPPADAAGTYYFALAYVFLPAGFNGVTQVDRSWIYEVAPCLPINTTMGTKSCAPANQQHVINGTVDTRQSGDNGELRPGAYLPPTMVGGVERDILLQLKRTPKSHVDGDVVDNSIDWRYRFFDWTCFVRSGNTTASGFASDRSTTGVAPSPSAIPSAHGTTTDYGFGQSFVDDTAAGVAWSAPVADGAGLAFYVTGLKIGYMAGGGPNDVVALYVRNTDGALVLKTNGGDAGQVFIRLRASAQYANFGTE